MKGFCTIILLMIALVYVRGSERNATRRASNDTEGFGERTNRDARKYSLNVHARGYEGNYEYKTSSNGSKGRRKSKPKTTTPGYEEFTYEEGKTGYEDYYKNPYVGNVGKIFNQEDINDYYLKGDNDYGKLVKGVNVNYKSNYYSAAADPEYASDEEDYRTAGDYEKKDGSKDFQPITKTTWGNLNNYDGLQNNFNTQKNVYDNLKNYESQKNIYDSQKSIYDSQKNNYDSLKNYENQKNVYDSQKNIYDSQKNNYDSLKNYENQKNVYDGQKNNYDGLKNYESQKNIFDNQKNIYDSQKNIYDSQKNAYESIKYKNRRPNNHGKYFVKTESYSNYEPTKLFEPSTPIKNYASNYNFDTRPLNDIEPTKYTIPSYDYPMKSSDYGSEYDMRGNPVSPFSDSFPSNAKPNYAGDIIKSFYDYNQRPDMSFASSDQDFRHGYAATYNYNPMESFKRLNKDHRFAGSVQGGGSQPILIPVPQPYPVKVPIAKPVAIPIIKEIKVPVEKVVPYPVYKNVPYPVEKRIPVPVEKQVKVPVPQPYPVKIPVIKNIYHHDHEDDVDHVHEDDHHQSHGDHHQSHGEHHQSHGDHHQGHGPHHQHKRNPKKRPPQRPRQIQRPRSREHYF